MRAVEALVVGCVLLAFGGCADPKKDFARAAARAKPQIEQLRPLEVAFTELGNVGDNKGLQLGALMKFHLACRDTDRKIDGLIKVTDEFEKADPKLSDKAYVPLLTLSAAGAQFHLDTPTCWKPIPTPMGGGAMPSTPPGGIEAVTGCTKECLAAYPKLAEAVNTYANEAKAFGVESPTLAVK